ncbi:integrase [Klebsiella pneumoniae]|nr:integrase [Klebsiella pneumoniae]HCE8967003.1 integrase [Klebsiella pneumoniae]HCG2939303.1 integrase [Klebsiella pneumoniae]HCH7873072.1 integrase [Klebsiella pneumoniae]
MLPRCGETGSGTLDDQLAHTASGSIRGIYNHAQYLDKRREMMQWWADYIDGRTGE